MILTIAMPVIKRFDVFGFFLIAALFFLFSCFVYILHKQKQIPLWKASSLYFITVLFLLTGGRLFTITLDEWQNFFTSGVFPDNGKITVLGALTFGTLGVLAGRKILGIKVPFLDELAIPVLFAMVIQRMGCLFAGCCGGIPTNSFYGLSYAPYTTAHRFCAQNGTLETLDSLTPALHPIPLYLLGICILSAIIIYKNKERFKADGSRFMAAISLFLFGRCAVEFWREPLTEGAFGNILFGLKGVQWVLILGVLVLALLVFLREKYSRKTIKVVGIKVEEFSKPSFYNGLMVLVFFIALFISIRSHFTPSEKTALFLFASISLSLYIAEYIRLYFPYYRYIARGITVILVVLFLPITAQVSYDSSVVNPYSYKEISYGIAIYNYKHYHQKADTQMIPYSNCNGSGYNIEYKYHEKYRHQLYAGALGYSQYFNYGNYKHSFYKIYGVGGIDESHDPDERDGKRRELLFNLEVAGGIDNKNIGLSSKLNMGRFRKVDKINGLQQSSLTQGIPVFMISLPSVRLRLGKVKYIYADIRLGTNTFGLNSNTYGASPSTYPYMFGLGSGLGKDNGNFARISWGLKNGNNAIGLGAKYCLNDNAIEIDYQRNLTSAGYSYGIDRRYYLGIIYSKRFGIRNTKN